MNNCTIDAGLCNILRAFTTNIVNPALLLLSGLALLIFLWGIVDFLIKMSRGEKADEGKQHMLWGVVGMFVIVFAFSIYNLVANTVASFGH